MFKKVLLTAGSIALMTSSFGAHAADPANTVLMELSTGGTAKIELRPDLAPKHAERIKQLTGEHFYDGQVFHRVIEGFMAQTGDPTGTGTSGSKYPDLPAEFSQENFGPGVVGMARKSDPNSANSQFFICFNDCSFLNGQYTVIGKVTQGMEFVDKIARGEPPANPDKIVKMTLESGAAGETQAAAPTGDAATNAETPAATATETKSEPVDEETPAPENTEPAAH